MVHISSPHGGLRNDFSQQPWELVVSGFWCPNVIIREMETASPYHLNTLCFHLSTASLLDRKLFVEGIITEQ